MRFRSWLKYITSQKTNFRYFQDMAELSWVIVNNPAKYYFCWKWKYFSYTTHSNWYASNLHWSWKTQKCNGGVGKWNYFIEADQAIYTKLFDTVFQLENDGELTFKNTIRKSANSASLRVWSIRYTSYL